MEQMFFKRVTDSTTAPNLANTTEPLVQENANDVPSSSNSTEILMRPPKRKLTEMDNVELAENREDN